MEQFKETLRQKQVANYSAYLQLKQLNYSDEDIASHIGCSIKQLKDLVSKYSLANNRE